MQYGVAHRPVTPAERHLVTPQKSIEEVDELGETLSPLLNVILGPRQHRGIETAAARSDPNRDATTGDVVESHQLPSKGHRVTKVG
jgi:hypothetical protein